ncbi:19502_t:CDS:1, partial [Racocetra persica]
MKKNESPCSIQNCSRNFIFRKITSIAYKKVQTKRTLEQYDSLEIGQEICYSHYLDIVEPDCNFKKKYPVEIEKTNTQKPEASIDNKLVAHCNIQNPEANINNKTIVDCNTQKFLSNKSLSFVDQVQILTKILYKYQYDKPGFIELSP